MATVKINSHLDMLKQEIQNFTLHKLAAAPASPVQGQVYYNTGDNRIYMYSGSAWIKLTVSSEVITNLTATLSATKATINSDTGTDADIPAVDATNAGLMTPTMLSSLNSALQPANVSSNTSLPASDDAKVPTVAAVRGYVATVGSIVFVGSYNASTNTPDIKAAGNSIKKGSQYVVSVGHASNFFGINLEAGDLLIATKDTPIAVGDWAVVNKNIGDVQDTVLSSYTALGVPSAFNSYSATTTLIDAIEKLVQDIAYLESKKSNTGHAHAWSEITSKPSTFTPATHSHATSDITGLDTALAARGRMKVVSGIPAAASTSVVVNHGLALASPFRCAVDVYEGGQKVLCEVAFTDANNCTVVGNVAFAIGSLTVYVTAL